MRVAIIGAGPSGLANARALQRAGIDFDGYEASHGVGGLWDIDNPRSTMYESAHLISSRTTTEFHEYPMRSNVDYPGHKTLLNYFQSFSDHFDLTSHFSFRTRVERLEPQAEGGWSLTAIRLTKTGRPAKQAAITEHYDHVILANGILAEPNIPTFRGEFSGEIMHASAYKSATQLAGKRVLIVGAGNSGCDIAVDAVHHAASIDMSVRRGYYFIPRYLFGKPSDTISNGKPMPRRIKQLVDKWLLRAFTGDPHRFGFPKPNYRLYESHPIINTLILNHLGQGDLEIRANIDRFDGNTVHFTDGSHSDYDLVLLATGYLLDYPFIDRAHLNWKGAAPELFLNAFPPESNGIIVAGMIEAAGLGWQGRYEQARLIATYLSAHTYAPEKAARFNRRLQQERWPDVTGGYRYLSLDRMGAYVNKHAYLSALERERLALEQPMQPELTTTTGQEAS